MAYFNGRYFIGGGNGSLYTSTDALNWAMISSYNSYRAPSGITNWQCITASANALFAVAEIGSDVVLLRTSEGFLWEMVGPCDYFRYVDLSNVEYLPTQKQLLATGYISDDNFSAFAYAK
jgi:hypothetical protein